VLACSMCSAATRSACSEATSKQLSPQRQGSCRSHDVYHGCARQTDTSAVAL
jgi:hypothetical protein